MLPRTRIKICGITNSADALLAVELGADALGFIFYPGSPRYISPSQVRGIIEQLPPFVTPVAVMVDLSLAEVSDVMAISACQLAQLHGEEPPEFLERLAWPSMKGISIAGACDLAQVARYRQARAILLDTKVVGRVGGTGTTFDWRLARQARAFGRPIILAGGLSADNIAEAMRVAEPDAIDVSSSIESAPGRKDPVLMRRLFETIRALDETRNQTQLER